MPVLKGGARVDDEGDARFHVEDAGSSQLVAHGAAWHSGERAQRIDGVVMAEQQHRLRSGLAGKIHLQVIAKVFRWMNASFTAELGEFLRDGLRDAVHGGFVVAGRFDFNQLTDGRDDLVAALVEVGKTTLRFGARARGGFSGNRIHVDRPLVAIKLSPASDGSREPAVSSASQMPSKSTK